MPNLYQDTAEPATPTPALDGDVRTDVVVIGGGITGLSTALHLAEQGAKVVLLEAEEPGWGASGRNGGQVNPGLKHDPDEVERQFGKELGGRMNALAGGAPEFVFDLIKRHGIRCDARRNGTLRAAIRAKPAAQVRTTAEQLARRGAPVELLEGSSLERATGTRRYRIAMLDRLGGDLKPLSYARALWPVLAQRQWFHAWGGRLAMTPDQYPHIHEPADGVLICLGYNGRGIAMGTTMGAQLARRLLDRSSQFDMPITDMKGIPLHPLWPLAVKAAIARGRLTDFLGI